MGQSLDKVLQPDGSYKWELVDLREENLYPEKKAAPAPARRRTKKAAEPKPFTPYIPETES